MPVNLPLNEVNKFSTRYNHSIIHNQFIIIYPCVEWWMNNERPKHPIHLGNKRNHFTIYYTSHLWWWLSFYVWRQYQMKTKPFIFPDFIYIWYIVSYMPKLILLKFNSGKILLNCTIQSVHPIFSNIHLLDAHFGQLEESTIYLDKTPKYVDNRILNMKWNCA